MPRSRPARWRRAGWRSSPDGYGHNQLASIFDELLQRSETMTRKALRAIPEGTYRFVDYLDNDGIELDKLDPHRGRRHGKGRRHRVRLRRHESASEGAAQLRAVRSVGGGVLRRARALTDPTIPTNGGCFRPIRLRLPKGTIVNPQEPAAVNAWTSPSSALPAALIGALRPDPARAASPAASAGELLVIAFGGSNPGGGRYVVGELIAGGSGAKRRAGWRRCHRNWMPRIA